MPFSGMGTKSAFSIRPRDASFNLSPAAIGPEGPAAGEKLNRRFLKDGAFRLFLYFSVLIDAKNQGKSQGEARREADLQNFSPDKDELST